MRYVRRLALTSMVASFGRGARVAILTLPPTVSSGLSFRVSRTCMLGAVLGSISNQARNEYCASRFLRSGHRVLGFGLGRIRLGRAFSPCQQVNAVRAIAGTLESNGIRSGERFSRLPDRTGACQSQKPPQIRGSSSWLPQRVPRQPQNQCEAHCRAATSDA